MVPEKHRIDQKKHDAYVKSIEADKLLAMGRITEARRKMEEAAALDTTYAVRAEYIGREDTRKIRVSATVRKILVPFLAQAGFEVSDGGYWAEGKELSRENANTHHTILIGRGKFGHRLSILAARSGDAISPEIFDWRTVGIRSECLAYTTQEELEAVCLRWCDLLTLHVFPWFDEVSNVISEAGGGD
jgi:hypothetical protein